jgi:UDP-N-acetylmuramoyl-tripeptide--D-alanyl-D-alanine ligase
MTAHRLGLWVRQEIVGRSLNRTSPVVWALAYVWRRLLRRTTFVAITGSLGKTMAKECVAASLAARFPTARSRGNQNSGAWLALNVLRVRPWHRYAVLEVAAGVPGRMAAAARLVRPDVAVVLSVARTHTTAYPSLAAHAAEKARLLDALPAGGLAVLNADDERVSAMRPPTGCTVAWFGTAATADVRARAVSAGWPERLTVWVEGDGQAVTVRTQLVGAHWTPVVLATLAVARHAGVAWAAVAEALRGVEPLPGRLQPVRLPGGATVLRDDYNAAVDTLDAALQVLAGAAATRRILMVSDFSDFGKNRKHRLRHLARAAAAGADVAVFVGERAAYGRRRAIEAGLSPEQVHEFPALEAATGFLRGALRAGDLLLLKGRTTDHATRAFHALLGPVRCWKPTCPRRILCDHCWELGAAPPTAWGAVLVPPPAGTAVRGSA